MDVLVSIDSPWDLASGCLTTEDLFPSIRVYLLNVYKIITNSL